MRLRSDRDRGDYTIRAARFNEAAVVRLRSDVLHQPFAGGLAAASMRPQSGDCGVRPYGIAAGDSSP